MAGLTDHLRRVKFLCAECASELPLPDGYGPPPPVVDCAACGTLCALDRPGDRRRVEGAKRAVKVVPTGLVAVMRPL